MAVPGENHWDVPLSLTNFTIQAGKNHYVTIGFRVKIVKCPYIWMIALQLIDRCQYKKIEVNFIMQIPKMHGNPAQCLQLKHNIEILQILYQTCNFGADLKFKINYYNGNNFSETILQI